MSQLLQEKSLATKFQILIEIAANQPKIKQQTIAGRLNITNQAVSLYIKNMIADGWIRNNRRSTYHITREGVNWLLEALRGTRNYINRIEKVIRNMSICPAVAGLDLAKGQQVGLVVTKGTLIANRYDHQKAKGVAVTEAKAGEDVGISYIEGIVELEKGRVKVLSVPEIQKGGSRKVDPIKLKEETGRGTVIGAIGIESITALRQTGITPHYIHGVKEAAVEAAQSGLCVVVACVANEISLLTQQFKEKSVEYSIVQIEKRK